MRGVGGAAAVLLLLIGCASPGRAPGDPSVPPTRSHEESPAPPQTPATIVTREWVAVFETGEPDDDRIGALTGELMRAVPESIAVSAVSCWPGLAEAIDVDPGLYAAAVVAPTRGELEAVAARVGRTPRHVGEYDAMCTD